MPDPLIYSFVVCAVRMLRRSPCGTWLKNNVAFFPATGSARPFSRPLLPVMPASLDHAASWMCGVGREAVTKFLRTSTDLEARKVGYDTTTARTGYLGIYPFVVYVASWAHKRT